MFLPTAKPPRNAIALIFDLEAFSRFFNQPDVSDYLAAFLNHVFQAVLGCIRGGNPYWTPVAASEKQESPLQMRMVQMKFMGDGALIILVPPDGDATFDPLQVRLLCNRVWNLKRYFPRVLERCADDVPVFDLPLRIRFGIARGSVIELSTEGTAEAEYVGFCINLASRLQKYCPSLGFIGSARLGLSEAILAENNYERIVATALRGFPKEIVFVDKKELAALPKEEFDALFARIGR